MDNPITQFLDLFRALAGDAAEGRCGDREAVRKLFKGTSYAQRHKDWFLGDRELLPRRAMRHHDYDVLRHLLTRASDISGKRVIADTLIRKLDDAHASYINEMDRTDARRDRGASGKTLYLKAACERVDRHFSDYGCSFDDLSDVEFVKSKLFEIVNAANCRGDLQQAVRLASALCLRLEKRPDKLNQHPRAMHISAAICAMAGKWAAVQCADTSASIQFHCYLARLYSVFPDVSVLVCVWRGFDENSHKPLKALALGERGLRSAVWDGELKTLGYMDGALWALSKGVALTQVVTQLGDRSPEQLFQQTLAHCRDNSARLPDYVVAHDDVYVSSYYSHALARAHRLVEASRVLTDAMRRQKSEANGSRYLTLRLKEVQLQIHRAEWETSKRPEALIACVREVDEAISLAKQLNLSRWVQRLSDIRLS